LESPKRYLVLAEGKSADPHYGKTARGVIRYSPHPVVAVLDSTRAGETMDGIPVVGTVNDALGFNPTTAIVGVATQGGRFPPAWRELLKSAISKGLDVENGLHEFIGDDPELSGLAARHRVELRDLRRPPPGLSVPTGENLKVPASIALTVGSDCAIGKKTVAVELDLEARRRGLKSVFVPTGQTGIAIAGWGIAVDAVISDFLAGAAEWLVVEGHRRGGELLFVEGQGSLVHPAYSGVTLGLVHGSAPHVFVLCHKAGSTEVEGFPGHPLPPLTELVELHERSSLPARPAKVAAVALNTAHLDEVDARAAIAEAADETGLPADDPVRFGAGKLVDAVLAGVVGGAATVRS
jgi:D-glutamate N-acetyltransferase